MAELHPPLSPAFNDPILRATLNAPPRSSGLLGLSGYHDSDESDDEEEEGGWEPGTSIPKPAQTVLAASGSASGAGKRKTKKRKDTEAARLAKRVWKAKRRATLKADGTAAKKSQRKRDAKADQVHNPAIKVEQLRAASTGHRGVQAPAWLVQMDAIPQEELLERLSQLTQVPAR